MEGRLLLDLIKLKVTFLRVQVIAESRRMNTSSSSAPTLQISTGIVQSIGCRTLAFSSRPRRRRLAARSRVAAIWLQLKPAEN
jgi:hypothetical protein